MKCECCGEREVTRAIKVEKDGRPRDLFVCDICAERYSSGKKKPAGSHNPNPAHGIGPSGVSSITDVLMELQPQQQNMFAKLWEDLAKQLSEAGKKNGRRGMKCPVCGLTREMLVENRRFGCTECYNVFSDEVALLLRELQFDDIHRGRMPKHMSIAAKTAELKKKLKAAEKEQRFEDAATISRELKELTGKKPKPEKDGSSGEEE